MPRYRDRPEDFIVHEVPSEGPSGEGPHLWLEVEKCGRTTEDVARDFAERVGAEPQQCGFAGRKDRHAVTRQWFSIPDATAKPESWQIEGVTILSARAHDRKLRPGDLLGNRFEIVVRDVDSTVAVSAVDRFEELLDRGLPNRFGSQRFGRDGDNAERGAHLLLGDLVMRDRRSARFLIAALQSAVFNRVLEARSVPIGELRDGDLALVHRNGMVITVPRAATDQERAARFELSPTGPMFGEKMKRPRGVPLEEELQALEDLGLPSYEQLRIPRRFRVPGTRRSLRARVENASIESQDDSLRLEFDLPAGSYATVLLEELFEPGTLVDASAPGETPTMGC